MLMHRTENPHRYNKKQETCSISFEDCGFIDSPSGFLHKKRFIDQFELLYVIKGALYIGLDGRPVTLRKNDLIILPPYKTLEGTRPSQQPTGFYYVNFTTDNPKNFGVRAGRVQTCHSPVLIDRLEDLHRQKSSLFVPDYVRDAHLLLLLHEAGRTGGGDTGGGEIASMVRQYVADHIAQPLTADLLSSELMYNKDYLCRIVKKHFGVSLKDYIIRQKLELSKKLLVTSNYSVKEIAGLVGYQDPNLFTKFFKYHTRQSPGDYRYLHAS